MDTDFRLDNDFGLIKKTRCPRKEDASREAAFPSLPFEGEGPIILATQQVRMGLLVVEEWPKPSSELIVLIDLVEDWPMFRKVLFTLFFLILWSVWYFAPKKKEPLNPPAPVAPTIPEPNPASPATTKPAPPVAEHTERFGFSEAKRKEINNAGVAGRDVGSPRG